MYEKLADTFKALSDGNRIAVLLQLASGKGTQGQILKGLDITQPTLSHHIKVLEGAGLIEGKKNGKSIILTVTDEGRRCLALINGEAIIPEKKEKVEEEPKPMLVDGGVITPKEEKEEKKEERQSMPSWLF